MGRKIFAALIGCQPCRRRADTGMTIEKFGGLVRIWKSLTKKTAHARRHQIRSMRRGLLQSTQRIAGQSAAAGEAVFELGKDFASLIGALDVPADLGKQSAVEFTERLLRRRRQVLSTAQHADVGGGFFGL